MNLLIQNNQLSSFTIQHLLGWIESLDFIMGTDDWPFDTMEELASQMEHWRAEFQRENRGIIASEKVLVMLYGEEVILIANQETGEYVTLRPSIQC